MPERSAETPRNLQDLTPSELLDTFGYHNFRYRLYSEAGFLLIFGGLAVSTNKPELWPAAAVMALLGFASLFRVTSYEYKTQSILDEARRRSFRIKGPNLPTLRYFKLPKDPS